jgi:hypothetical protein
MKETDMEYLNIFVVYFALERLKEIIKNFLRIVDSTTEIRSLKHRYSRSFSTHPFALFYAK